MTWRAIPVALVLMLAAAACGGDDGDDEGGGLGGLVSTTTSAEVDETTTTSEPDAETTTTTSAAPDAEIPDGWSLVETDEFSIGLPPGWMDGQEMVSDPAFAAEIEAILGGPEQVEALYAQLDMITFDRTTQQVSGTNVNVIVNPRSPLDGLDTLEAQVPGQLQQAFSGEVTSSTRVQVGGIESLRIVYEYDLQGDPLVGVQYYVLGEAQSAVITFTTSAGGTSTDSFTPIAETFRFA